MNYSVYKHTSPSGKVYIGITGGDVNIRWMRGYGKQTIFGKAIRKYGWNDFKHEVLFTNLSKEKAELFEIRLIFFMLENLFGVMELKLIRKYKAKNYCIGHLYVNGVYECDTLEDADRGLYETQSLLEIQSKKIYGQTAIPYGTYKIDMNTVSPKFKDRSWAKFCGGKLPRLIGVKGYEGVLIHVGNKAEDTLGCILVGENKIKGQVINSTATFQELYSVMLKAKLLGEELSLTIE